MQHWNRLPRYYALKDSTLHEQSIWASLRTISFDFFLSHPASLLLILTSCVNTRKEDRELPSYTNKSTYFIRFVHILSFFSSIYTLLRIFFIMHWELGHSIQSSGTKYNSKPRHVPSCITKVISMSNIACQDHQRDTNDFSSWYERECAWQLHLGYLSGLLYSGVSCQAQRHNAILDRNLYSCAPYDTISDLFPQRNEAGMVQIWTYNNKLLAPSFQQFLKGRKGIRLNFSPQGNTYFGDAILDSR